MEGDVKWIVLKVGHQMMGCRGPLKALRGTTMKLTGKTFLHRTRYVSVVVWILESDGASFREQASAHLPRGTRKAQR